MAPEHRDCDRIDDEAATMLVAITVVEDIARHVLDDDRRNAREAMHAICEVAGTVRDLLAMSVSAEEARLELLVLRESILAAADPKPQGEPS